MASGDVANVLARLDDLAGRLASAKSVADLQESIGRCATSKSVIDLQESMSKIQNDMRAMRTAFTETQEENAKLLKKLIAEVMEAVEGIEAGGEVDDTEPPEWAKPIVSKLQQGLDFAFSMVGEKDVKDVIKGRVKSFLTKKVSGEGSEEE